MSSIRLTQAKTMRGEVLVPGDKSISHRALMFSALADGTSEIRGLLRAADPFSTLSCLRQLGVEIVDDGTVLTVHGKGRDGFSRPSSALNAGNSGTTIRLLSGILAGQPFASTITGDEYLVRRPMKRIIDPLRLMGANVEGAADQKPPLAFHPAERLSGITYSLPVPSAQVKSAVLLAGLFAQGSTEVIETIPSRDHTERMLHLPIEHRDGKTTIRSSRDHAVQPCSYEVPGDPSSAAFFIVAGLIVKDSEILVRNVGLNPSRRGFLDLLRRMGGSIRLQNERVAGGEPLADVLVKHSALRNPGNVPAEIIPNIIDEIPILSVAAAFGEGEWVLHHAEELRHKECDRVTAMSRTLRAMGVVVDEYPDGFGFVPRTAPHGGAFVTMSDHRIAMASAVAAIASLGESTIDNSECVDISYPNFWETLSSLIAN
ncbi:MAG: 3-phosphoshikimate 1-carboxyvinyltransferase [Ignavibacteriales bacterium]|nr:3-phosphoshikimate 1-carboxyvinyltransferase [Ignavibacteriales bacterium]